MFKSTFCTGRDSCRREMTRDVVFLVIDRGMAPHRLDSVWLTREEADQYVAARRHNFRRPWVYGLPANGELAQALQDDSQDPPVSVTAASKLAMRRELLASAAEFREPGDPR